MIPNCRRIFGAHAPHPTPENPHPITAISWGPRDLAARLLRSSLTHDEWARSGPRRLTTIWGTWPPDASPPFGITHLALILTLPLPLVLVAASATELLVHLAAQHRADLGADLRAGAAVPASDLSSELACHVLRVDAELLEHAAVLLGVHLVGQRLGRLLGLVRSDLFADVIDHRLLVEEHRSPPERERLNRCGQLPAVRIGSCRTRCTRATRPHANARLRTNRTIQPGASSPSQMPSTNVTIRPEITPRTMSIQRPNPLPVMILPASQPTMAPTTMLPMIPNKLR